MLFIGLLLMARPAFADDEVIVLSPTRTPTPVEQVGSSVTVITADDIALKQARNLPEALQDVPGLNLVQTGGPGGVASLFLRGTNSNHVKVLLDGIDASDPSTPTGAFDASRLLTGAVEQVEVLRGPQSGLWGSDAIGGVVSITSRSGSGPARFDGALEGGSFSTFDQSAALSGSSRGLSYAFDLEHLRTGASPVTPPALLAQGEARHDDACDNLTASAKLGLQASRTLDLGLVARYVRADLRFTSDFDFGPGPDPVQSRSTSDEVFTRAIAHLVSGTFDQTLGLAYTRYDGDETIPNSPPAPQDGDRIKADWQGGLKLAPGQLLTLGAEGQREAIHQSPISADVVEAAAFAELQSSFADRLFDAASVRFDHNGRFGSRVTWRIAPALTLPDTDTRLKASVGTGFKAPSLNELYVSYPAFGFSANPDLKPETSLGWDIGVEQALAHGRVRLGATWFENRIRNLIEANDDFTTSVNVGRASSHGVESFAAWRPSDSLTLRADYTFTRATDDVLHQELLRRPEHKASAEAVWRPTQALALTGTVLWVGSWIDGSRDFSVPRLTAPGYVTANVTASWRLGRQWSLYGRITNLADRRYQDPIGFLAPGRGVFVGLRFGS
jgi:vitamin B12 transporter